MADRKTAEEIMSLMDKNTEVWQQTYVDKCEEDRRIELEKQQKREEERAKENEEMDMLFREIDMLREENQP